MKKSIVVWLVLAVILVIVGGAVFVFAMAANNWDFTKLSTSKYVTNTYEITEAFENIKINGTTEDIIFIPLKEGNPRAVCTEKANRNHKVYVESGTLNINTGKKDKWYNNIGFFFGNTKIKLYIPAEKYGDLSISSDTGDINIPKDFSFKSLDINSSTGGVECLSSCDGNLKIKLSTGNITLKELTAADFELSVSTGQIMLDGISSDRDISLKASTGDAILNNVRCNNLTSTGSTGDISLKNVISSGKFNIKRSTGDILLDGCDATELIMKTSTGAVSGTLLSEKVFITDTSTGAVNVPKTTKGGKCEVSTGTGSIILEIKP